MTSLPVLRARKVELVREFQEVEKIERRPWQRYNLLSAQLASVKRQIAASEATQEEARQAVDRAAAELVAQERDCVEYGCVETGLPCNDLDEATALHAAAVRRLDELTGADL